MYTALKWACDHANEEAIDTSLLCIGGSSAGGGLAAGLSLLARDRGEVDVAFQFLNYPMIDDREITVSSRSELTAPSWTAESNRLGWRSYLGALSGGDVPIYAAPARATDLAGLPPAYLATGQYDLFRDENIDYVQRLLAAGVPTELHVYPRAVHGSDVIAPASAMRRRWVLARDAMLRDIMGTKQLQ